jgi:hypothetical protein
MFAVKCERLADGTTGEILLAMGFAILPKTTRPLSRPWSRAQPGKDFPMTTDRAAMLVRAEHMIDLLRTR